MWYEVFEDTWQPFPSGPDYPRYRIKKPDGEILVSHKLHNLSKEEAERLVKLFNKAMQDAVDKVIEDLLSKPE